MPDPIIVLVAFAILNLPMLAWTIGFYRLASRA
jgi:hypothetical protein